MSAQGLDFRVTHIAVDGTKRTLQVVGSAGGHAAMEWVEQLYGEARVISAVCLRPMAGPLPFSSTDGTSEGGV
jgi:hypothetical protein